MNVDVERHQGWAQLTLNRPERRNAIVGPLATELASAIRALDEDEDVQAILLCGAGGAFCSGLDLKEFNADPEPEWLADFGTAWRSVHVALFECMTPIVGALERFAINGGAALALACDLLIVGEDSYLQIGEVRQGMAAPYNLAWLALRHPESVGIRLSIIGDRVPGPALVDLGVQAFMPVAAVGGPTARVGNCEVGQRQHVSDDGLNRPFPVVGSRHLRSVNGILCLKETRSALRCFRSLTI